MQEAFGYLCGYHKRFGKSCSLNLLQEDSTIEMRAAQIVLIPMVELRRTLMFTILLIKFYFQNGLTALHKAAKWGHTNVIKTLLASNRFNVNVRDKVSKATLILYPE